MKKSIVTIFWLLVFQCGFAQADTILNRYKKFLLQTLETPDNVDQLAGSITSEGQWTDINYQDQQRGGWQPLIHLKRLRELAFAYSNPHSSNYHNLRVLNSINGAMDHWLQRRYKCPNWWHNEIGVPQQMRDIVILIGPTLSAARWKGALEVLGQYRVNDNSTGANLTWSADLGLHYGLLTNDSALVRKCRDLLVNEIMITTKDGVQPDYSFHQHDARLQMYQYGAAFLKENVRLAWEVRNTQLAFPKEKLDILTDFVLRGWQWMTRGINTVPGTMDRSASRINALHSADLRELIPFFMELIPDKKAAFVVLNNHQNGEGTLSGFRYYPYSDFAAYQQAAFSFFVKTISDRTLATESINSENLKGRLLNSGDAYLIRNGTEYFNLMPVWNWEYLPGITAFKGADKIKRNPFAGSVTDGKAGFTSMDYLLQDKSGSRFISAKKSWFCYKEKVICLVADLKGTGVDSAYTVMDQCRWNGEVTVNKRQNTIGEGDHSVKEMKWVHQGNFFYAPLTKMNALVALHSVFGSWASINASESDSTIFDKIFMPVLLHQNLSKATSFGYWAAYCKTPTGAERLTKRSGFKIIKNDSQCQAISFTDGTVMASFFEAGSLNVNRNRLSVEQPCMLMIRGGKFYVSDPQQKLDSVNIRFNAKTMKVSLPEKGFSTRAVLIK